MFYAKNTIIAGKRWFYDILEFKAFGSKQKWWKTLQDICTNETYQ